MNTIGDKLKWTREKLELTQEEVAHTLGLTRNIIGNIENGNREVKADELYKFSKLYGVTMEELVADDIPIKVNCKAFANSFGKLSEKDKLEILNLIKFKNSYIEEKGE